jgi:hypothetical protein
MDVDRIARLVSALGRDDDLEKMQTRLGKLAIAMAKEGLSFLELSQIIRRGVRPDIIKDIDDWPGMVGWCYERRAMLPERECGLLESLLKLANNGDKWAYPSLGQQSWLWHIFKRLRRCEQTGQPYPESRSSRYEDEPQRPFH